MNSVDFYKIDRIEEKDLLRNQHDPVRAAKIVTRAHERRLRRKAKALRDAERSGARRPVFKLDLRKAQ